MRGMAMGKLAGTVASCGGVGLLGVGSQKMFSAQQIEVEYRIALEEQKDGKGVLGFGFLESFMEDKDEVFDVCMTFCPEVAWLSGFTLSQSDTSKWMERIRALSPKTKLIVQTFTVDGAVTAASTGADAVVIQGCDAGGHGHQDLNVSLIALLPQTRLALNKAGFSRCPLIAAGGIANGNQMAAALILGADAVVMGTSFVVTQESLAPDPFKQRILDATLDATSNTFVSHVWDHLSHLGHFFGGFPGRALRNSEAVKKFAEKDAEEITPNDKEWYAKSGYDTRAVWCSTSSGLISSPQTTASDLIQQTIDDAISAITAPTHFQIIS